MDLQNYFASLRNQTNLKRMFLGFCEKTNLESLICQLDTNNVDIFLKIINEVLFQDEYVQEYTSILLLDTLASNDLYTFHPNTNYRKAFFIVLGKLTLSKNYFHFLSLVYQSFSLKIRSFECPRERQLLLEMNLFVRISKIMIQNPEDSGDFVSDCLNLLQEINPLRTFIDWPQCDAFFWQLHDAFWSNSRFIIAQTKLHHKFLVESPNFPQILHSIVVSCSNLQDLEFLMEICIKTGYAAKFVEVALELDFEEQISLVKLSNLLNCLSESQIEKLFLQHFSTSSPSKENEILSSPKRKKLDSSLCTFFEKFFLFHAKFPQDSCIFKDFPFLASPLPIKFHTILLQRFPAYRTIWKERDLKNECSSLLATFLHLQDQDSTKDSSHWDLLFQDCHLNDENFTTFSHFILPSILNKMNQDQIEKISSFLVNHLLHHTKALENNFHIWNCKAFQKNFSQKLLQLPPTEQRDAVILAVPAEPFSNFSTFPTHLLPRLRKLAFSHGFDSKATILEAMHQHCESDSLLNWLAKKLQFPTDDEFLSFLSQNAQKFPHKMLAALLAKAYKQQQNTTFQKIPDSLMNHFFENSWEPEDLLLCRPSEQVASKAFDLFRKTRDIRYFLPIISAFPTSNTLLDMLRLELPPSYFIHLAGKALKSQFSHILATFRVIFFNFRCFYQETPNVSILMLRYASSLMEAPYKGKQLRMILQLTIPAICSAISSSSFSSSSINNQSTSSHGFFHQQHVEITGQLLCSFIRATYGGTNSTNSYIEPALLSCILQFFHTNMHLIPLEQTSSVLFNCLPHATTSICSLFCCVLGRLLCHITTTNHHQEQQDAQLLALMHELSKEKSILSKFLPKVIVQVLQASLSSNNSVAVPRNLMKCLVACLGENEHAFVMSLLACSSNENEDLREVYRELINA